MTKPSARDADEPGHGEFRERLRSWLLEHASELDVAQSTVSSRKRLTASLYDEGLLWVSWPKEYGGGGLPSEYQSVWNEECASIVDALTFASVTVGICAATLLDFGSEAQKRDHLPRMLRGDEVWTQLLSEPGAGSDLASVSTRARRHGDVYQVTGQKVWTSGARESDYAFALVRTAATPEPRSGVSMLIIDMNSDGVDVRPLREMTGESLFNEVFLEDVVVSVHNLVGTENDGWTVLVRMLTHERLALSAGTAGSGFARNAFPRLVECARRAGSLDDPEVRAVIFDVFVQERLLEYLGAQTRAAMSAGIAVGPVGSLGKIGIARAARAAAEAGMAVTGTRSIAWPPGDRSASDWAADLLRSPMMGIAGGTTEIQKNVVAERLLHLPRERRDG